MIRNVERKASFCEMFRFAQHDDESAGAKLRQVEPRFISLAAMERD